MAKKQKPDEDSRVDQIRKDHFELVEKVESFRRLRSYMQNVCNGSTMRVVLSGFESDIEKEKELLVSAEKKDVDRLQATIKARRSLLEKLKTAYEAELEDATRQLKDFESANELLIAAAKVGIDVETGEVKEA